MRMPPSIDARRPRRFPRGGPVVAGSVVSGGWLRGEEIASSMLEKNLDGASN